MDKDTWFRILQVAVVAPFIYSVSEKQNGYFKLGLKLVAGAIIIQNIVPLFDEVKPLILAAQKIQQDKFAAIKSEPIEAEYSEKVANND